GTELGIRLNRDACDLSRADFDNNTGTVHIEGGLTLDYEPISCIADVDLATLEGQCRVVKSEAKAGD
ncbi:MAG TPA: MbtH domain protein, partial [Blastocatellia bacterium]|nr:MbtH domain protein [Blastocatellia bacterium]